MATAPAPPRRRRHGGRPRGREGDAWPAPCRRRRRRTPPAARRPAGRLLRRPDRLTAEAGAVVDSPRSTGSSTGCRPARSAADRTRRPALTRCSTRPPPTRTTLGLAGRHRRVREVVGQRRTRDRRPGRGGGTRVAEPARMARTATGLDGDRGGRVRAYGCCSTGAVDRLWGSVRPGCCAGRPAVEVVAAGVADRAAAGRHRAGVPSRCTSPGIVPEATARLRSRRRRSTVSERTMTLSTAGPTEGEYRHSVTLAPGRYTLTAYATRRGSVDDQHLWRHHRRAVRTARVAPPG